MNILGVNYYQHHAAAALVVKGNLIAAAEEERFTRIKHDGQLPTQAIAYCLQEGGLELSDIDLIAISVDFLRLFREKYLRYTLNNFPAANALFLQNTQNIQKLLTAEEQLRSRLNYSGKVDFYKHHLCHAASSYYLSGFKEAVVVSVDGLGEIETTIIAHANKKEINIIREQNFPHSLGLLYEAMCAYLGYRFGSEGIVMALASFGNSNAVVGRDRTYQDIFNDMVKLEDDALFKIDLSYFNYPHTKDGWVSSKFIDIFGPHKSYEAPITQQFSVKFLIR
jgi:carbamoyltransferase